MSKIDNIDIFKDTRTEGFSVYQDLLGFIPSNVKLYARSFIPKDFSGKFSEKDLSRAELESLDQIIFAEGTRNPGYIDYPDYKTSEKPYSDITRNVVDLVSAGYNVSKDEVRANPDKYFVTDPYKKEKISVAELEKRYPGSMEPEAKGIMGLLSDLSDPRFSLKTSLGRAKVTVNENGDYVITDTFDFNENKKLNEKQMENLQSLQDRAGLGASPIMEFLRRKAVGGKPIPIEINLGSKEDYEARQGIESL
tara:strand:- start:165 stop:917 length:753 start_codon:yes stop_codon:yes gene_type:complete